MTPTDSSAPRTGILITATMATGLTAGVFADWSNAVMPGLRTVDDRTFVTAFQALDASITSPLFLGVGYLGALLFTALSAVLHRHAAQRPALLWIGAALVCYLAVYAITFGVHEPLNQTVRTPDGGTVDFAAARAALDEASWTTWNTVRALAATIAFGCLTWALVIHRRFGRQVRPTRTATGH